MKIKKRHHQVIMLIEKDKRIINYRLFSGEPLFIILKYKKEYRKYPHISA